MATLTHDPQLIADLRNRYLQRFPAEAARSLASASEEDLARVLGTVAPASAAALLQLLGADAATGAMQRLATEPFTAVVTALDPQDGVALLSRLPAATLEARLGHLEPALADEYRELLSYPLNSAGSLMDPRVTVFHGDDTVQHALQRLRQLGERRVVSVCLVDDQRRLQAAVSLQEVAVAAPELTLQALVTRPPVMVSALASREEVVTLLEDRHLASLPVVDAHGKLLGIIRYDTLVSAAREEATEDVQAMFGASRDERALSGASYTIRKRLPWLIINLGTVFLAALVVGLFESTISRIIALAVFLPVVAGQSGNTGSQALAVTMRGLALREVRPRHWPRVARKELIAGLVNGLVVSIITAGAALVWMGSPGLAVVIALALVASTLVAGVTGATIPVVLKQLGQDPAQSSSIILTTVTDVFGFLSFLGLAALLADVLSLA